MNKYFHLLSVCSLLCILSGCLKEEWDNCPTSCQVTFSFKYDYNIHYADRFAEEVDHVSLFIYDTATEILQERIDMSRTAMQANHSISTELPSGNYTVVVWGNCDMETDYFSLTNPEKLSSLRMGLTCIDEKNESTVNKIGSVFHAISNFKAVQGEKTAVPMSMTKNTNRVRIIIRGLDEMTKEEAEETMKIRVSSDNWLYKYDNNLATNEFIEYRSDYTSGEDIIADFYILRMQVDYENDIYINLQHRDLQIVGREPTVLMEQSLIPLLIEMDDIPTPLNALSGNEDDPYAAANEFLDRQDEYEIVFDIAIDGTGNPYIEEWDRITKPGEF